MSVNTFRLFTEIPQLQLDVMRHCCEKKVVCMEKMSALSPAAEDYIRVILRRTQTQISDGSIVVGSVEHALSVYSVGSLVPDSSPPVAKAPVEKKVPASTSSSAPAAKTKHPAGSISALLMAEKVPENILNTIDGFYRCKKRINFIGPRESGFVPPFTSTQEGETTQLHAEKCGICDAIRKNGKKLDLCDSILAICAHCKSFTAPLAQTIRRVVSLEISRREKHAATRKTRREDVDMESL